MSQSKSSGATAAPRVLLTRVLFATIWLAALAAPAVAEAGSYTVNLSTDAADATSADSVCDADASTAGEQCTLRAAVQQANSNSDSDDVTVPAGTYALSLSGAEDLAATGDLDITNDLQINGGGSGPGPEGTVIEVDRVTMNPDDRVFHVIGTGTFAGFHGLTIRNGNVTGRGGGIRAERASAAQLIDVTVAGNAASQIGGGVYAEGATLDIAQATITGNSAANFGGGGVALLASFSPSELPGDATIATSLITNNSAPAGFGGGLLLQGGTPTVRTTTLSGNSAASAGGGIYTGGCCPTTDTLVEDSTLNNNSSPIGSAIINDGTNPRPQLTVRNSTIVNHGGAFADNGITYPAAVFNAGALTLESVTMSGNDRALGNDASAAAAPGIVTLSKSILANSTRDDCASGLPGPAGGGITSAGHNLIEAPGNLCSAHATDITAQDPLLAPLASNGGPTETLALGQGSPALDAVAAVACPLLDQRGATRPVDGPDADLIAECDSGAYEAAALSVDDVIVAEGDAGAVNATFTITRSGGRGTSTVSYSTANGTATQPGDYMPASGILTFPDTDNSETVTIQVNGDTVSESANETFFLNLSAATNSVIADAQGSGTIVEDDQPSDTDGDGTADPSDQCPTQAGPASNNGCPVVQPADTDGDGTADPSDQCPTQAGPASNNGCPVVQPSDTDGDGTADPSDQCPTQAGPASNNGCPVVQPADTDGDGTADPNDQCPSQAGPASNEGCPLAQPSDSDPPETTITKAPPNKTDDTKVKYKFASDEPGSTFECKIDKKPFKPCSSPKKVKVDEGKHKFLVRAVDSAGNVDPSADKDRFRVAD